MERNGFVRSVPHTEDRRKINIYLTDEGQALRAKLLPSVFAVIQAASAGLTQREITMMLDLLKTTQRNLQE